MTRSKLKEVVEKGVVCMSSVFTVVSSPYLNGFECGSSKRVYSVLLSDSFLK